MIKQPNFKLDTSKIPKIQVKSIHYQNFKAFENEFFDFTEAGGDSPIKKFSCFFGPNGTGKTTILDSLQTIFSCFDSYDKERLQALQVNQ